MMGLFRRLAGFAPDTQYRPCQSDPAIFALMETENSWVFVAEGQPPYTRFDALTQVLSYSKRGAWLVPMMHWPWVYRLGTALYKWMAAHRSQLSPWTAWLPIDPDLAVMVDPVETVE
jgi:predicted DCC family thiol-disulfide oxidoreductase YuxK